MAQLTDKFVMAIVAVRALGIHASEEDSSKLLYSILEKHNITWDDKRGTWEKPQPPKMAEVVHEISPDGTVYVRIKCHWSMMRKLTEDAIEAFEMMGYELRRKSAIQSADKEPDQTLMFLDFSNKNA